MKIKKLALTGFKSFTDRTEVPFSMGLSAIVGPNGCGKSNLVDAIRWAMGEQSAKLLRGRQMEDVIFCGSDGSKAMGMAEVSLLFENGDGSFPPQFADQSEISVTRRLYRSGESEYLINNVPCRLKDIQEIFMDTGLGNRAYSIIGQGKIGSIIEQKPEETRAMVEEAAGITKYKKKVEESQRKIELAKGNLQRVEDILGEVMRQMRSLKRQAAKARSYKTIAGEIQDLEISLAANSYHQFKAESEKSSRSIEELKQEEVVRSAEFSRVQAEIETVKLELEEKEREIAALRGRYIQAKERVAKKESNLESLIGEKRMQVEMETRLEREKQELRRKQEDLKTEKEVLLQKIEKNRENASLLEEECSLLEKRAKARQEFLKQVREVYEEARTRVNAGMSKEMSLSQETGYIHKRMGEITSSRARLESESEDLRARIESLTKAYEKKNQDQEASREYQKVLKINPGDIETLTRLADIDLKNKRYGEAIKSYEKIVKSSSRKASVYANLGFAYGELKKYRQSVENYRKSIKYGSKDPQVRYNLAYTYNKLGRSKEAMQEYEKLASAHPTMDALDILADRYMEEKRYESAIKIYKKMIALSPKRASAYSSLGYVYGLRNEVDKEIEYYKISLKYDAEDDDVYVNLGAAYEKKGMYEDALTAYKTAYALNPDSSMAAKKIPALKVKLLQQKYRDSSRFIMEGRSVV